VTTTLGSCCVPPDCGGAALGAGVAPAAGAEDAGGAAGVSLPGGDGAVCAKAPAQSEEIRKDVEASSRGRNNTETPW